MPFSLLPGKMVPAITDLDPCQLYEDGIRLLMLDFDNTIVPYTTDVPTQAMEDCLKNLMGSPLQICVVSNSHNDRVIRFCEKRGIPCIIRSAKPFGKGISRCLEQYGIPVGQAAIAGDQIFTDVLGGNLNGVTSILVEAIDNHNFWLKARHVLEMPFIFVGKKRRKK